MSGDSKNKKYVTKTGHLYCNIRVFVHSGLDDAFKVPRHLAQRRGELGFIAVVSRKEEAFRVRGMNTFGV